MMLRLLKSLNRDKQGVTIVEFGLIAPTLLLMLMGLYELGHGMYVQSIVSGAMQDAGRDATLEGAKQSEMRELLKKRVLSVSPGSEVKLSFRNFGSYTEIGELEDFKDINGDGKCSKNEPYEDLNENGMHDYYDGEGGIGNARDAVVFRAVVEYDRIFPMPTLAGWSQKNTVEGVTVLRNQPFRQNQRVATIGQCTGTEDNSGGSCSTLLGLGLGLGCSEADNAPPGKCHTTKKDGYHCHEEKDKDDDDDD
ncbi:pilus assembly protein [Altererythrobacter sp.]|nr:pilus assembly protein [Altererythrobacter sp.]